jgi:hypothetical protein
MRLLRLAEVESRISDRVFYYSRAWALFVTLTMIGASAAFVINFGSRTHFLGYYIAAVLIATLLLMRRFLTARFRPSNWLVRITDDGLYIKFRSYLNYHLPEEDLTVVFISYQEIRSARLVKEKTKVPDMEGGTSVQYARWIELELAGDPAPLAKALAAELATPAPRERRWYGNASTLYRHYPVRMASPECVRMRWSVVPGAATFLEALRPYTTVATSVRVSEDFANINALTREEQEKRLRELDARGETIAAVHMAQRLYGYGLSEADAFIKGLRKEPARAK